MIVITYLRNDIFRSRISLWSIILPLIILALASCGTGRNAVSRGKATPSVAQRGSTNGMPSGSTHGNASGNTNSNEIVKEAYSWLGTRYVYGGHSKNGTDCSGLVMEVFLKVLNLKLPRASYEQQAYCRPIDRNSLAAGDLVFFAPSSGRQVSHVGIYIGNGNMIHASESRGVMISNIFEDYFVRHYHSSGHVDGVNNLGLSASSGKASDTTQEKPLRSVRTVHINDLDRVLENKTDSILSNFMD